MTDPPTTPVVCARCATTSTTLHRGLPWCQHCEIWLVLDPATGEWVSFAERDRRIREADYMVAVTASATAVAEALPRLTGLVPDGWSVSAGQTVPDTLHVLTLTPPPSLVRVSASLRPPYQGHGWYVRVDNRTEGVDYPLYEPGGVRAAYFPTAEDALQAALTAVHTELA
jgi:hypothetical protein